MSFAILRAILGLALLQFARISQEAGRAGLGGSSIILAVAAFLLAFTMEAFS